MIALILERLAPITEKEYQVGGSTALLDAIGSTIHKISNAQKHTAEEYRAEKVMFVIITDGEENSSVNIPLKKLNHRLKDKNQNITGNLFFLEQT